MYNNLFFKNYVNAASLSFSLKMSYDIIPWVTETMESKTMDKEGIRYTVQ